MEPDGSGGWIGNRSRLRAGVGLSRCCLAARLEQETEPGPAVAPAPEDDFDDAPHTRPPRSPPARPGTMAHLQPLVDPANPGLGGGLRFGGSAAACRGLRSQRHWRWWWGRSAGAGRRLQTAGRARTGRCRGRAPELAAEPGPASSTSGSLPPASYQATAADACWLGGRLKARSGRPGWWGGLGRGDWAGFEHSGRRCPGGRPVPPSGFAGRARAIRRSRPPAAARPPGWC